MRNENKPTEAFNEDEEQLLAYVENGAVRHVMELYAQQIEDMVEGIDEEIEEADEMGFRCKADALARVRNALDALRIDLDIEAAERKLEMAKFEKFRNSRK